MINNKFDNTNNDNDNFYYYYFFYKYIYIFSFIINYWIFRVYYYNKILLIKLFEIYKDHYHIF